MQKLADLSLFESLSSGCGGGLSVFNDLAVAGVGDGIYDVEAIPSESGFDGESESGGLLPWLARGIKGVARKIGDWQITKRDRKKWAVDISRDLRDIKTDIQKRSNELLDEIPDFSVESTQRIYDKIEQLLAYYYGDWPSVDHFTRADHEQVSADYDRILGETKEIISDRLRRAKSYVRTLRQYRDLLDKGHLEVDSISLVEE